ncbi:MAG: hypothetical protein AB1440_06530, partial [Pseudomonadota bacterium]
RVRAVRRFRETLNRSRKSILPKAQDHGAPFKSWHIVPRLSFCVFAGMSLKQAAQKCAAVLDATFKARRMSKSEALKSS